MTKALTSLPCVEPSSISVDIETKQARFQVKPDQTCNLEEVKHAIAAAGNYEVTNVKLPAK